MRETIIVFKYNNLLAGLVRSLLAQLSIKALGDDLKVYVVDDQPEAVKVSCHMNERDKELFQELVDKVGFKYMERMSESHIGFLDQYQLFRQKTPQEPSLLRLPEYYRKIA